MYKVGQYRRHAASWRWRRRLERLLPQVFAYPADGMMRSALPWLFPLDDGGIILTKYGALQRTVAFRGIDDQSSNRQVQADFDSRINNVLRRVGSGSPVGLWIEADRHYVEPLVPQPRDAWGTAASWVVDSERVESFNGLGRHLETDCYITYLRQLPTDRGNFWRRLLIENAERTSISAYREFTKQFMRETDGFAAALREAGMPEARPLDVDETLTYLHNCVSARRHKVAAAEWGVPIDDMLADSDLVTGLAARLGRRHVRAVSILKYPGKTYPSLLTDLDDLGIEYRAVWRWLPFSESETDGFLDAVADRWKRARKGLRSILWEAWSKQKDGEIDGTAVSRGAQVEAAAEAVRNDHISLGRLTLTVLVAHDDLTIADEMAEAVQVRINGKGFTSIVETYNTTEAIIGTWPGQPFADMRRRVVNSMNLAHLMRTTTRWSGPPAVEALGGAPPLITCSTGAWDLFRFVPWVQDVGHVNVFGPNGSGKSLLIALWAMQFMRYSRARVVIFEQGRSARIPTLCAGGTYYTLEADTLSFQPLRHIDDEAERAWARDWICDRIEQAGVSVDPAVRNRVWDALTNLAAVKEVELKTLSGFVQLYRTETLDDPVKAALQDFTTGPYARYLNGDRDTLDLGNRWVAFELGKLVKVPRAAGAVLAYIFHRLEAMFDGRPTVVFLDEGWRWLLVGDFALQIKEWLKTLRKRGVSVVFASQEIADSVNSEHASTLVSECLTKVYLANGEARSPEIREYYRKLGLRDDQIDLVGNMVPKRDYLMVNRDGTRVFDLGMSRTPVGLRICGASTDRDHATADRVLAEWGRERFLEGWLVENNFADAVDALREEDDGYRAAAE